MNNLQKIRLLRHGQYWHLSDSSGCTVWPAVNYFLECVDLYRLSSSTIELRAYAIKLWIEHLHQEEKTLLDADDYLLRSFAQRQLNVEKCNVSSDTRTRKRSINQLLRCIYRFYAWLQTHQSYKEIKLIGAYGSQITSTLTLHHRTSINSKFPLIFRFSGEKSKHSLKLVPTEENRRELIEYFFSTLPHHLASRNCLIMDIAWSVGWRRGSILSLTIDQFMTLGEQTSFNYISPKKQKFGYNLSFEVDPTLISRIVAYIEFGRRDLVGITKSKSIKLFLSSRTGLQLKEGSVSEIFSKAKRHLGWPSGAGIHSWRRAYANKAIAAELDRRVKSGLDTSYERIAHAVASKLGHESASSQDAYIRSSLRNRL